MPTQGRPTLNRAIASLTPQLHHGDELLVIRRDGIPYGNATRDEAIPRCMGSHLWWVDDDDIAVPNALEVIRAKVGLNPGSINVFCMQHGSNGSVLGEDQIWQQGRVGGPMCVVPNVPGKLGMWAYDAVHCGDFNFLKTTLQLQGGPPVWHEDIIYTIRPTE